ncbi:hypothetical protein RCL1_003789 [Eukaryota sp. TZLM3-RCL]
MADLPESLFGCFNDFNICLCGYFCPACLSAQTLADADNRACTLCDLVCAGVNTQYFLRMRLRSELGLSQSACGDCFSLMLCPTCYICQNARIVKQRKARGQMHGHYPAPMM